MVQNKSEAAQSATQQYRILIVDDHPIVRQGLMQLIQHEKDLIVCGEAESASEGLRAIAKYKPDVAIVDLSLKDGTGLELTRDIKVRFPALPVLVLSMHDASIYAERALRSGAKGYLMKDEATEKVVMALRQVLKGDIYLSAPVAQNILYKISGGNGLMSTSPVDVLSDRELEIFRFLGQGVSTRMIAQRLHRSVKTIDSHRENIKRKLNLRSAGDLLQHAIQWVRSEEP